MSLLFNLVIVIRVGKLISCSVIPWPLPELISQPWRKTQWLPDEIWGYLVNYEAREVISHRFCFCHEVGEKLCSFNCVYYSLATTLLTPIKDTRCMGHYSKCG